MKKIPSDYSKEAIAKILMHRDDLDERTAWDIIDETQWQIADAVEAEADLDELYAIIEDYLGLEPDYLDEFLAELL